MKLTTTVCHQYGDTEIDVEFSVSPGYPGQLSGPPEHCYPSEPPDVDIIEIVIVEPGEDFDGETIDYECLSDHEQEQIELLAVEIFEQSSQERRFGI